MQRTKSSFLLRRAVSEALESRRLLAFNNSLANDPNHDPIGVDTAFNTQSESASLAFTSSGETVPTIITAYNDFGGRNGGRRATGWAVSTNGGRTFDDKGALPYSADTSQGVISEGGDPVLTRDDHSGTIYLTALARGALAGGATAHGIHVFRSTNNGQSFADPVTTLSARAAACSSSTSRGLRWTTYAGPAKATFT
jgi:hypothetical protein